MLADPRRKSPPVFAAQSTTATAKRATAVTEGVRREIIAPSKLSSDRFTTSADAKRCRGDRELDGGLTSKDCGIRSPAHGDVRLRRTPMFQWAIELAPVVNTFRRAHERLRLPPATTTTPRWRTRTAVRPTQAQRDNRWTSIRTHDAVRSSLPIASSQLVLKFFVPGG